MAQTGVAAYLDFDEFDRNPTLDQAMLETLRPTIHPRSDWASGLAPQTAMGAEDDVRFLLVHHTATENDYGQGQVTNQIREFYELHTGPARNWPDVAYNFLIDRFGGIWEARAGSLSEAVRGDATGGSQGFAQLCSLIGNHHEAAPTVEAQEALISLLAWLSHRHRIDSSLGATVDFTSRGSNRWPSGASVIARTISGHRDMSDTICPGDYVYVLLEQTIPEAVSAKRAEAYDLVAPEILASEPNSTSEPKPADPDPSDGVAVEDAASEMTEPTGTIRSEAVDLDESDRDNGSAAPLADRSTDRSSDIDQVAVPLGVAAVLGAIGALVAIRRRRMG